MIINDITNLKNEFFLIDFSIFVIPLIILIIRIYIIWNTAFIEFISHKIFWTIISIIIAYLFILFTIFFYKYLPDLDPLVFTISRIILYILLLLFLLYVIYQIFLKDTSIIKNISIFIINILLLISNSIIFFSKWIYQNFTFNNVILLLIIAILILIILLYIYSNNVINYITLNVNNLGGGGGVTQLILKEPVFINNKIAFSLKNTPTTPNYTFSLWLYINNYTTNNNEIPIFKFGSSCPNITINNNTTNNMMFYASQHINTPFSINSQKWNYIVIQYTKNGAELYVNCSLIYSVTFNKSTKPKYINGDNVVIGSDNVSSLGIGAISNVNYYNRPLSLSEMNRQYEIIMLQNIPSGF